ncbi:MAG: chemotaxis protein CheW, partial [Chloroflexota bacterium]
MPESNLPADLQSLWDELNQSDSARRQRLQRQRFAQRAEQFAEEQSTETGYTDNEVYKTLVFQLGNERYAMTVDVITSVHPQLAITRVPGLPRYYRGVVNLRGQIVSVLDLGRFLDIQTDTQVDTYELIFIKQDTM